MDNELSDRQWRRGTTSGRQLHRRVLPDARSFPEVVSPAVASVSKPWPQRAVRSNEIQPTASEDLARTRTDDRERSPEAGFPDASGDTLQLHWGQFYSSQISGLARINYEE
jgi:hypothetical protein